MPNNRVFEWFRFADTDLAIAQHLLTMHPQPYEQICYHCQQSTEKYLKGYLIFKGIDEPPKIHNLTKLCAMCSEYDSEFDTIAKMCSALSVYGVQPRYPDEIYIDEELMKKALRYAKSIKDFAPLLEARHELENIN